MKILYVYTEKTKGQDLLWSFYENGHIIAPFSEAICPIYDDKEKENEEENKIYKDIIDNRYDGIVSWNYFSIASNACEKAGIPYMSWLFDSPLLHIYASNMCNSCNYIFAFDRPQYEDIRKKGGNCFYLPLAINTSRLNGLNITDHDIDFYKREIAFVGSLYQNNPYRNIKFMPDEVRYTIEKIYNKQLGDCKHNYIYDDITPEIIQIMNKVAPVNHINEFPYISSLYVYAGFFFAREFASRERTSILNMLAKNHKVTLYNSADNKDELRNIECCDAVNYETEAPKVYFSSRINLNMTLRSIEEGLPLRVFDIMGVGGFLLSNYQKAFYELYEPDKDMVMYSSMEELAEKADFYLGHENERLRIAMNGYKKTCKCHTMKQRVQEMLRITYGEQI